MPVELDIYFHAYVAMPQRIARSCEKNTREGFITRPLKWHDHSIGLLDFWFFERSLHGRDETRLEI